LKESLAIPIAAVIAILPFLFEPIIFNRLFGSWLAVKWLLVLDAVTITVLAVVISYFIDKRQLRLFQKKIRAWKNVDKMTHK
jgi:hypothetical protein